MPTIVAVESICFEKLEIERRNPADIIMLNVAGFY